MCPLFCHLPPDGPQLVCPWANSWLLCHREDALTLPGPSPAADPERYGEDPRWWEWDLQTHPAWEKGPSACHLTKQVGQRGILPSREAVYEIRDASDPTFFIAHGSLGPSLCKKALQAWLWASRVLTLMP